MVEEKYIQEETKEGKLQEEKPIEVDVQEPILAATGGIEGKSKKCLSI